MVLTEPHGDRVMVKLIFKLFWWHWMKDYKIIRVKGWRTAIVEGKHKSRQTITCCFSIFGCEFD